MLELDVDVLYLCAVVLAINSLTVRMTKSSIICAGTKNPVTLPADEKFYEQAILYYTDFMTNARGALKNSVNFASLPEKRFQQLMLEQFLDGIYEAY